VDKVIISPADIVFRIYAFQFYDGLRRTFPFLRSLARISKFKFDEQY